MSILAVIFDLGGVVLGSPLEAFLQYERELGLPEHTLNRGIVAAGPSGAWARLERGELDLLQFYAAFDAEHAARGIALSAEALMAKVALSTAVRPEMVNAIRSLRAHGVKVAALTNNWASEDQTGKMDVLRAEFDVFVESVKVGLRKPDPEIFQLVCRELGVEPLQAAFLDDIGLNVKAARALGMKTIKVGDAQQALRELSELTGIALAG